MNLLDAIIEKLTAAKEGSSEWQRLMRMYEAIGSQRPEMVEEAKSRGVGFLGGGFPGISDDTEQIRSAAASLLTSGPYGSGERRRSTDIEPVGASNGGKIKPEDVTDVARAVSVGAGKTNPDAMSPEELRIASAGVPRPMSTDYERDPRFSDEFKGVVVGKLGEGEEAVWPDGQGPPTTQKYDKLQRIREQAAAKGGFKVGREGSFTQPSVKGLSLEQTPEYQAAVMAELDRTWADRRIKQLVGRGGLSGSKRDREELKDLIEFEKSNRYSESILQSNLADARGRQSQAAATVQAAQIGAQGEMSEKAESKIFDYFDKRAQLFKDAEDYDSAQEVWDIYADETLTVSQKIAALKKLKVMKGTSTSDIEGAKAKLFGSNSGG